MDEITDKTFFPDAPASFEEKAFEKVKTGLSQEEKEYFLKRVLPALNARPQIEEFFYPAAEKQQDLNKLKEKQAKAEIDANYIKAKIFEYLLADWIERENWLGEETMVTETGEADDWLNGVDSVAEFGGENSPRLAIDFTTESNSEQIKQRKNLPIYQGIERGELAQVKYFVSQIDQAAHRLTLLPKVVIALSSETIGSLIGKKPKELENHWTKTAILLEIREQLRFFLIYIKNLVRPEYDQNSAKAMALKYRELLAEVEDLTSKAVQNHLKLAGKLKTPHPVDEALLEKLLFQELSKRDRAFAALMRTLT